MPLMAKTISVLTNIYVIFYNSINVIIHLFPPHTIRIPRSIDVRFQTIFLSGNSVTPERLYSVVPFHGPCQSTAGSLSSNGGPVYTTPYRHYCLRLAVYYSQYQGKQPF